MTNPNDVTGSHEVVVAHTEDSITTWTLNMPEARNPISGDEVVSRMVDLAAAANADRNVRVVILTGAGSAFSAGGNVKDMVDRVGMFGGNQADIQHGYTSGIQRLTRAIYGCEVPIIAAVNGPAVGAGCDLALMADMRIASESAFFAESFVKLGLIPGDGGAWLLPRAVGAARAAEMAFTGDRVDAATALEWGLVSRVVAADALMDTARQRPLAWPRTHRMHCVSRRSCYAKRIRNTSAASWSCRLRCRRSRTARLIIAKRCPPLSSVGPGSSRETDGLAQTR